MPSFVALISCSATEPVYFVKIEKKKMSEKKLRDCHQHTVLDSETFITGKYLQKITSNKTNKKQFKILEKNVVHYQTKYLKPFWELPMM